MLTSEGSNEDIPAEIEITYGDGEIWIESEIAITNPALPRKPSQWPASDSDTRERERVVPT